MRRSTGFTGRAAVEKMPFGGFAPRPFREQGQASTSSYSRPLLRKPPSCWGNWKKPYTRSCKRTGTNSSRRQDWPEPNWLLLKFPCCSRQEGENRVDAVLLVTAPGDTQRKRVLERGTMTEREFEILCSRQIPDKIKRQRADFVIETFSFDETREEVRDIINKIKDERWRRRS